MDEFTNLVAPVMMTTSTRKEQDEKKRIDRKRQNKKTKEKDTFEEEFAAVYVPGHEDLQPITYQKPRPRIPVRF